MSQLRKREYGPEAGAASTVMVIIKNDIRLRLKIERGMAAPFQMKQAFGATVD